MSETPPYQKWPVFQKDASTVGGVARFLASEETLSMTQLFNTMKKGGCDQETFDWIIEQLTTDTVMGSARAVQVGDSLIWLNATMKL